MHAVTSIQWEIEWPPVIRKPRSVEKPCRDGFSINLVIGNGYVISVLVLYKSKKY